MKKNIVIGIILIVFLVLAGLVVYYFKGQSNAAKRPSKAWECADCGPTGWQKYPRDCNWQFFGTAEFKDCLEEDTWDQIKKPININEIKEGYIVIGQMDIYDTPVADSIKVLIYGRIAADKNGNLYILTFTG